MEERKIDEWIEKWMGRRLQVIGEKKDRQMDRVRRETLKRNKAGGGGGGGGGGGNKAGYTAELSRAVGQEQ